MKWNGYKRYGWLKFMKDTSRASFKFSWMKDAKLRLPSKDPSDWDGLHRRLMTWQLSLLFEKHPLWMGHWIIDSLDSFKSTDSFTKETAMCTLNLLFICLLFVCYNEWQTAVCFHDVWETGCAPIEKHFHWLQSAGNIANHKRRHCTANHRHKFAILVYIALRLSALGLLS